MLDDSAALPEGAEVHVAVVTPAAAESPGDEGPTLFELLEPVIGKAQGLPPDASRNVDHYLYGQPKR